MTDAFPQLVTAVQQFSGDIYSESQRWAQGYSDCSSFVGKGLKSLGITPPGASVTTDYMISPDWTTIPRRDLSGGDICVNAAHMIVATGNDSAIGQENSRVNVATGTPENLMLGTGGFTCRRYKNAANVTGTPTVGTVSASTSSDVFTQLAFPQGVVNFFNMLTEPGFLIRIAMSIGGAALMIISLYRFAKEYVS